MHHNTILCMCACMLMWHGQGEVSNFVILTVLFRGILSPNKQDNLATNNRSEFNIINLYFIKNKISNILAQKNQLHFHTMALLIRQKYYINYKKGTTEELAFSYLESQLNTETPPKGRDQILHTIGKHTSHSHPIAQLQGTREETPPPKDQPATCFCPTKKTETIICRTTGGVEGI